MSLWRGAILGRYRHVAVDTKATRNRGNFMKYDIARANSSMFSPIQRNVFLDVTPRCTEMADRDAEMDGNR